MRWWSGLSARISAASVVVLLLVVSVANQIALSDSQRRMNDALSAQADSVVARWQIGLLEPVWNLNADQIQQLVEVEFRDPAVEAAQVVDASGAEMVGVARDAKAALVKFEKAPVDAVAMRAEALSREDEKIGEVRLWMNNRTVVQQLEAAARADFIKFGGVGVALIAILLLLLRRWVTAPLGHASSLLARMAELKPGEPMDAIRARKDRLIRRYGDNTSETGALVRSVDRFVGLFGELKVTGDAAQRASRGLTCASANLSLLDENGKVVLANDAFVEFLQRHPKSASALGIAGVSTGADLGPVLSRWLGHGLSALQAPRHLELELGERHGMIDLSPVESDRGEAIGCLMQWHDMTEALNQRAVERRLVGELARVVAAAGGGDLKARIDAGGATGVLVELCQEINELLGGFDETLRRIQELHAALAAGNLGYRLSAPGWKGVFAEVRDNANSTIERMAELVSTLREAARSVSSGASEIRGGTDELSRRIEKQASSLEESAAAMKEMTKSVTSNERDSRDASSQSASAEEAARRGGEVIARMQTRMNEIGKGSRRIMEIVGLIDDIAFQTNLLALNAAVEAARAGELGRGFAVVASEVRSLAKRASDNSKDIRGLLSSSDAEVQQGIELTANLSRSIAEISEAVSRAARLSRTIAEATTNQATGIRQVEAAIDDLDGITQQNSAIAEQTAASSATLDDQAANVMQMLSRFSLGETDSARPSATRRRA